MPPKQVLQRGLQYSQILVERRTNCSVEQEVEHTAEEFQAFALPTVCELHTRHLCVRSVSPARISQDAAMFLGVELNTEPPVPMRISFTCPRKAEDDIRRPDEDVVIAPPRVSLKRLEFSLIAKEVIGTVVRTSVNSNLEER